MPVPRDTLQIRAHRLLMIKMIKKCFFKEVIYCSVFLKLKKQ